MSLPSYEVARRWLALHAGMPQTFSDPCLAQQQQALADYVLICDLLGVEHGESLQHAVHRILTEKLWSRRRFLAERFRRRMPGDPYQAVRELAAYARYRGWEP